MEKIILTKESETLFIPLYGKATVHEYGDILIDKKAEEIVKCVDYDFQKTKSNKFINIYMGIRAAILDSYAEQFLQTHPDGIVLHLGCGLDSRVKRIGKKAKLWIDIDLPDVILVRRQFFEETDGSKMLAASATETAWLKDIPYDHEPVLIIAEGLTMYLTEEQNRALFAGFAEAFDEAAYVFDAYSVSAVKWSKRKNPVNKMGAVIRFGLDEPKLMESTGKGVHFLETKYFTGREWEEKLHGSTRFWFHVLYGNRWANSLYRIYCYRIGKQ